MMDWRKRIQLDPAVCHGKPCVRGTRIMVSVILDNLADGLSAEAIVAEYPPLVLEDVRAAMAYAADLAREEDVLSALRRSPEEFGRELRLAAAIHWYQRDRLSQEMAAQVAGLDRTDFLMALARRGVDAFSVDFEDLERELARS